MKLSTMKKVYDAAEGVPMAEFILQRWGFDPGTVGFFRASANFVFIFRKEGKTYFMRCNDACERELGMIEAEVEVLQYLSQQSIRIAEPVRSQAGRFVESVETKIGTFYAVVFQALKGNLYEFEELEEARMKTWGRALGRLHQVCKEMPSNYAEHRPSWRDYLRFVEEVFVGEDTAALRELEQVRQWAEGLTVTEADFGLIHYDFESDNLCWDGDVVSALDFDDCARHWYVADIGYALRDLWSNGVDLTDPRFLEFMEGYTQETTVNEELLKDLPWFMRMHDLYTCARLIRSADLPKTVESPSWMPGLVQKVQGYVERYREGFRRRGA